MEGINETTRLQEKEENRAKDRSYSVPGLWYKGSRGMREEIRDRGSVHAHAKKKKGKES